MKRQLTVGQYRAIDLALFAIMLAISEALIVSAATRWFPNEPYTVSVVAAVTAIVLMRWGGWAAIHAALGGLVFCAVSGATGRQFAIYGLGNLLSLGALGLIRGFGSEAIRSDDLKTLLFGLVVLLLMQLGRALVAMALGAAPMAAAGFFTTDVISVLFTLVILWIARRLDGIFEDQKHYLLRVQQEREEERGGF